MDVTLQGGLIIPQPNMNDLVVDNHVGIVPQQEQESDNNGRNNRNNNRGLPQNTNNPPNLDESEENKRINNDNNPVDDEVYQTKITYNPSENKEETNDNQKLKIIDKEKKKVDKKKGRRSG